MWFFAQLGIVATALVGNFELPSNEHISFMAAS
jgi:hypothetical protein